MTKLIPISEVSSILGIARSTVYKLISDGELEHVKIGRSIRFDPNSIENYIKSHTQRNAGTVQAKTTPKLNKSEGGLLWEL